MAREWQPAPSFSPDEEHRHPGRSDRAAALAGHHRPDRSWSVDRGAVAWEGTVDLLGSFPGFALSGGRAQSLHLSLTDRFLLVDEFGDRGFGLPIGWLSAVQALTGAEPIGMASGVQLRVCYVDGNRIRGFMVRVRGGRFGRHASRRADQLRSAASTLGLASARPSTDLPLPPDRNLSISWEEFAAHENEPVIWTGRATMPVAGGLEVASSDVWLTGASLIWGTNSRAGIYRLATASLTGITMAGTPGRDPIMYWSLGGTHHTQVDLPMIFTRHDRAGRDAAPEESLRSVLEEHGYRIDGPVAPPQPWRTALQLVQASAVPMTFPAAPDPAPLEVDATHPGEPAAFPFQRLVPDESIRRRLLDDGLFPERTAPALPRSRPLPWGDRVERLGDEPRPDAAPGDEAEEGAAPRETGPSPAGATADPGRVRVWPSAAPRRDATPSSGDAAAMLVRRPPLRAKTTDEFLAAEREARTRAANGGSRTPTTGPDLGRGVMVQFRRPELSPAVVVQNTVPPTDLTAYASPAASLADPAIADAISVHAQPTGPLADEMTAPAPEPVVTGAVAPEPTDAPTTPAPPARDIPLEVDGNGTALDRMRSVLTRMDEHLSLAIASINDPDQRSDEPTRPPLTPLLQAALSELDELVRSGQFSAQAAQTHRQAITRTADTTERLRSLQDLYARGYLSAAELAARRESLLGRTRPVD